MTQALRDYVIPLMQGEVKVKMANDGLPEYTRFKRHNLKRKCQPRT